MKGTRHTARGFLYIGLAAVQWGIAASLGRAVFTGRLRLHGQVIGSIDPLMLAQSRGSISFLILAAILLARRGTEIFRLPLIDIGRAILLGTLGVAASNYLYYLAIQRTNVATAIIVQYTAPVWVLFYMVGRGLQKATLKRIGAVGLALTGIALVIDVFGGVGLHLDTVGMIAAILAAFSFSYYNVAAHGMLARYDRWKVLLWTLMVASCFWLFAHSPAKVIAAGYTREQWMFMTVFSVVSVLGPFSCYFAGLQHLEPTSAVVASCLEPVFAILIAALALGEGVNITQGMGILLVLLAIVLIQWPEREEIRIIPIEPVE